MVLPLAAAKAYAAVQAQAASLTGELASGPGKAGGPGFEDILKNAMNDAIKTSKTAESQIVANVQGKADLVDVATAISSAQTSLQTVLAVRDQVIAAYQQVLATPI